MNADAGRTDAAARAGDARVRSARHRGWRHAALLRRSDGSGGAGGVHASGSPEAGRGGRGRAGAVGRHTFACDRVDGAPAASHPVSRGPRCASRGRWGRPGRHDGGLPARAAGRSRPALRGAGAGRRALLDRSRVRRRTDRRARRRIHRHPSRPPARARPGTRAEARRPLQRVSPALGLAGLGRRQGLRPCRDQGPDGPDLEGGHGRGTPDRRLRSTRQGVGRRLLLRKRHPRRRPSRPAEHAGVARRERSRPLAGHQGLPERDHVHLVRPGHAGPLGAHLGSTSS